MSLLDTINVIAEPFKALNPVLPFASAALSFLGGERRNEQQADAASAQMEFQREMSNTAYQRAVEDMRKAGLNPMLAAKMGGSSTPLGAMPQYQDTITPAIQSGVGVMTGEASAHEAYSRVNLNEKQWEYVDDQVQLLDAELKRIPDRNEQLRLLLEKMSLDNDLLKEQGITQETIQEMNRQTAKRLKEETDLLNLDVNARREFNNLGAEVKEWAPLVKLFLDVIVSSRR